MDLQNPFTAGKVMKFATKIHVTLSTTP